MSRILQLVTIIIFSQTVLGFSQEKKFTIPDSLKTKTFDELEASLNQNFADSIKFSVYSNTLLVKSKQEENFLALAKAYRAFSFNNMNNISVRIQYLDSSIAVSKHINDIKYPAISYSNRADAHSENGDYTKALDDYLQALNYSKQANNIRFYYITKHNIGELKKDIGEYEAAALMFKEILIYEDDNGINTRGHLSTVLSLSEVYIKLKKNDSATFYNKKGVIESIKSSPDIYHLFVMNEGINLTHKEKYQASLDSLNKGISFLEEYKYGNTFLVDGYLCLSEIYKQRGNDQMSLEALLKIDKKYEDEGFVSVGIRQGYESLIEYYKSLDDTNKQLYYINKLFAVDSVLDAKYKNLSKKIVQEYDRPKLLEEKQNLISILKEREKKTDITLVLVIILTIILIVFVLFFYIKNIKHKKRYSELMNNEAQKSSLKVEKDNSLKTTPEAIGISESIVNAVLEELEKFESNNEFLSPNITTSNLAKKLRTNSKYLSKVINSYKKKSFSVYINELRIDYVIDKLKSDRKFRLYTIKAISREIGFNTTEAFSKSFYKKTGIYPSFFIKQLEKQK
ncbi:AraC family transcriptional regulator [Aquimarina sp. AD10]|uniref:AraC family transcriptional regulator n=1 Tax=Aquimarina sp. AD10 TaxID=1714849 RepID=UPI000E483A75|nr:AraC family transcriptional regulator [Aquimarina sp. AD10]AXT62173.1 AraC family transcriptional regulator [Aquimarina sp. AD10]RKM90632.1 helix-turn-helix domain-containing protein [Aquimarina sp. AD10]